VPDFDVRVLTSGAPVPPATAIVSVRDWTDDDQADGTPTPIHAHEGIPMRRFVAPVHERILIHAVVGGVEAPADSALGGRLFSVECCEGAVIPEFMDMGQSSVVCVRFRGCGHYALALRRPGGGSIIIPIDVVIA
jgi:hypothetical protein